MSRENVETVRRFTENAREDPGSVWDIFDEDVEWEVGPLSIPDFPPTSHGPVEVREFFRNWVSMFEDWAYEVEEVLDAPDAVALRIHQWGTGRESGAAVDQRFWQVWTMRGGKAIRVAHMLERADALEAAGLSE